MYPGEGAYPGAAVEGFSEAWAAAIAGWKSHEGKAPGPEDRAHVETHVLLKCDAFIIDDGPLLVMCRWLREENGFAIDAMRLEEYLQRRPGAA